MMDSPFLRTHWNQPSRPHSSPSVRGIPVHPVQRQSSTTSSPKVVSIPVQFVGSETSRSASALKIQKVFRGLLVRKSVKRILPVRNEVDEIERKISRTEAIDLIRKDPKERLRVNEMLMALLLKLDSIRGVDSGVRDCRKAVIKKVIALQEKVDAIVAAADRTPVAASNNQLVEPDESNSLAEAVDQNLEIKDANASDASDYKEGEKLDVNDIGNVSTECSVDGRNQLVQTLEMDDKTLKIQGPDNCLTNISCCENTVDNSAEFGGSEEPLLNLSECQAKEEGVLCPSETCEKMDVTEVGVDYDVKRNEEPCAVKKTVEHSDSTLSASECGEGSAETGPKENWSRHFANPPSLIKGGEEYASVRLGDEMEEQRVEQTEGNMNACSGVVERDDNKWNRELLERMMEDNEKMMNLMTKLYERNEVQTRMLSSLTQRVEHLERAFMCDRMRRNKKRHAAGTVDSVQAMLDKRNF